MADILIPVLFWIPVITYAATVVLVWKRRRFSPDLVFGFPLVVAAWWLLLASGLGWIEASVRQLTTGALSLAALSLVLALAGPTAAGLGVLLARHKGLPASGSLLVGSATAVAVCLPLLVTRLLVGLV